MRVLHPNLELGDIVMLKYESKFGQARYRLGRVVLLHPDVDGVVRTVSLRLRDRRKARGEGPEVCRAGGVMLRAPVQRLVMILPASEQPPEVLQGLLERQPQQAAQDQADTGHAPGAPASPQAPAPAFPQPHAPRPLAPTPEDNLRGLIPAGLPPPLTPDVCSPAPVPGRAQRLQVRAAPAGEDEIVDLPRPRRVGRRIPRN